MRPLVIGVALALWVSPALAEETPEQTVHAFVQAYNDRDMDAFAARLAPDARWYSVDGDEVGVDGEGREAITAWTRSYLTTTCPTCRSEFVSLSAAGAYLTAVERASWTKDGAARSQTAVAVYEVRGGLIRAVWYFPSEKP